MANDAEQREIALKHWREIGPHVERGRWLAEAVAKDAWQAAQSPLLERIRELEQERFNWKLREGVWQDWQRLNTSLQETANKAIEQRDAAESRVAELEQGMREMLEAADAMTRSWRPWDKYYEAIEKLKALAPIPPSTEPK